MLKADSKLGLLWIVYLCEFETNPEIFPLMEGGADGLFLIGRTPPLSGVLEEQIMQE